MTHGDALRLSLQLAVFLAIGLALGRLAHRLGLPVLLGELLGGVLLGPTVFGRFAPETFAQLFPPQGATATARNAFIHLGLLCFLFAAGLEVNVGSIVRQGRRVALTSALGVVLPFGFGFALASSLPSLRGKELFLGTALSISALPVIARTLMDLGLEKTDTGTVVLAAATVDDLIGWCLFAGVLAAFDPQGAAVRSPWITLAIVVPAAAFVLTAGRWIAARLRSRVRAQIRWPGGVIGVAAVLWLLAAVASEWAGVHAVFGAFMVGLMLSQERDEREAPHEVVHQFALGVFAPIYFVSIGMRADFARDFDAVLVLAVLGTACVGKIAGASLGARLGGFSARESLAVGFGMNARGAMEMILAGIALERGLIGPRLFVALVVMAVATSVISGPAMKRLLARPAPQTL
jgi:Kef-type K+ transport system membrane component KefB